MTFYNLQIIWPQNQNLNVVKKKTFLNTETLSTIVLELLIRVCTQTHQTSLMFIGREMKML